MKKVFVIASLSVFALASCKKDYTCECTVSDGSTSISTSNTVNGKKKDVTTACENGSSTNGSYTTVCKIK